MLNKKKIFFLADSTVDLIYSYDYLKNYYETKWVVYNDQVRRDLIRLGYHKKEVAHLQSYVFLKSQSKLNIFLNKCYYFTKFKVFKKNILIDFIKKYDEKFSPDLWITDTGNIMSKINVIGKKCTFHHTVSYKQVFLLNFIFDYDKVFIPGKFHLNRILKFHKQKSKILKKKLRILTSPKLMPLLNKNKNLKKKKNFLKQINLNFSNKTVLFATTFDAFKDNRFLPYSFNNQFESLKKIALYVTQKLNCNFIIKLHHYHHKYNFDPIFREISEINNVYIFQPGQNSNIFESNNFLLNSDIVITDTSGVGPICTFLDKKIIFLEPDKPFDWSKSDINSHLRPGFVCKTYPSLINALKKYNTSDAFRMNRKKFVKKIFYQAKNIDQDLHKKIRELI